MTTLQSFVLGILQGVTEFLPISSSGHLVLVPWLLGWPAPGLAFSAILHWGTALAVLVVFWRDLWRLLQAAWSSLRSTSLQDPDARLAWWILLGSLPAAFVGLLFEDFFAALFETPRAAAAFLIVTGLLLLTAERFGDPRRDLESLAWLDAIWIGLAQAAAIAPGLSRSGTTIASGLLLGLRRTPAARFSFLLMVPATLGAGALSLLDLTRQDLIPSNLPSLIIGFLAAAFSGILAIRWLLGYLTRHRLTVFAGYTLGAGTLLLLVSLYV